MIFEYFRYYAFPELTLDNKVIEAIPDYIKKELLFYKCYIEVEAKKKEIIWYLDDYFKIGKKDDYCKRRCIEIDELEVDKFEYFRIELRTVEYGVQVFYGIKRPTCPNEYTANCFHGAAIVPPVSILANRIRSLQVARIRLMWTNDVAFIISEELKNAFEQEKVTGLSYQPCWIKPDKKSPPMEPKDSPRYFMATITHSIPQKARVIRIGNYCPVHSYASGYTPCDVTTPREHLLDLDFQRIDGYLVDGKRYHDARPYWIASQKVLKILLRRRIPDLRQEGTYLKKPFVPLVID